ncbi:hypothetical protein WQ56_01465 [Luteimonas sp. FCS-9]|nr:hypothetical protein WQ56_01465 [Luteimonas sp. FCS-9]
MGTDADRAAAHVLRAQVFVAEQGVPAALERDALDADCRHVLAVDADGAAVGTGRLAPDGRIGRLAVRADRRGRGIGDALLRALLELAHADGLARTHLHAQLRAMDLYARHGFVAHGPAVFEAGIEHRAMHRHEGAAFPVDDLETAVGASVAVILAARRGVCLRSRDLDPGLYDHPDVLRALQRFATAGRGGTVRILLQDAAALRTGFAPVVALAQRLPSVFAIREVDTAPDRGFAGALLVNDAGGFHVRPLAHRVQGEAATTLPARARRLVQAFDPVWERSRPATELRALGI